VKCQVEMLILVRKEAYCEALAKCLGLIWFESLLEGEENIQWRLARNESKMYRLLRTGIIKKMVNAASASPHQNQHWQLTPASAKGIIYIKDDENELHCLQGQANYCVLVENNT
jgi:hypothetical protein